MITKSQLNALEQEMKSQWKGVLTLVGVLRYPGFMSEPERIQTPSVLLLANNHEADNLCSALEARGIVARTVEVLEEATALIANENVQVVVVDEVFVDSASACWELRKDRIVPVAVTGSSPEREGWDKVVNLEADAYLPKSMSLAEQVARIKALLRRY